MKRDFLYKTAEKIFEKLIEKDKSGTWYSVKVKEDMGRLYPFSGAGKVREHYIEKIRLSMLMCAAGSALAAGLFVSEVLQPVVKENKIYRQGYEGDTQEIAVKVTSDDEKEHELTIKVRERIYGREQLENLYQKALPELEKVILGGNESAEHVDSDLLMVTDLPGYPFKIEWESMDYHVIDAEGEIQDVELPEEGVPVGLNAVFTYEDFRAEYLFYVQVFPKTLTREEEEKTKLLKMAEEAERENREEEILFLPQEMEGKKLTWKGSGKKAWAGVLFLAMCAAVLVYFLKDEDLKKEVKKREEKMKLVYPELVSKLSIYLGAGMTLRAAWEKICTDYEKKNGKTESSPVYEEMYITCQEVKSGISELSAYERFGKRCGIQMYSKFSALLTQNLRKGSTRLGPLLKEESRLAFEERKNAARKAGETAGTKLLLPMMMMLCVVMLMILLPAFMTF